MAWIVGFLRGSFGSDRTAVANLVADLPAYQVALWPDGWELDADGGVRVWDTHAMAEARRWYELGDRNRPRNCGRRVMSLHGIFVPRAIVDLANRRFVSEKAASVAVNLIAGEWVDERRRRFLKVPWSVLADRSLSWRGSRHEPGMGDERVRRLVEDLLRICVRERLIPDARYRVRVRSGEGYGICTHRCVLDVGLDRYAAARALEALGAALVPWNRAVARDHAPVCLIELELGARSRSQEPSSGA